MHFTVLNITQDERRRCDENFIPLWCLIHGSPFISHVRGAWFTWVPSPLTFGVLDSCESPCLSRSRYLIHVSLRASHIREWMSVCFITWLNVQSEHKFLRCKHLLYFESFTYSTIHIVPRSWMFVIDKVFYPSPEIIIKDGEIWSGWKIDLIVFAYPLIGKHCT